MTAVWMQMRAELRARWRALLALALILGVAGSVVLFAAAGARRTDSAYARLATWVHGPDDIVSGGGFGFSPVDLQAVARLPQVTASTPLETVIYYPTSRSDHLVAIGDGGGTAVKSVLGLRVMGRPKLLEGRQADPSRVDEVEVGYASQQFTHVHAGAQIVLHFWKPGVNFLQYFHSNTPVPFDRIPKSAFGFSVPVTVTGITVTPGDFPENGPFGDVTLTPAFIQKYGRRVLSGDVLAVKLRPGTEGAFQQAVARLSNGGNPQTSSAREGATSLERSIRPQAVALRLFAVLAAIAGLLVFAQALARQTFLESAENPTLRSLGMSPGQLFGVAMVRSALVGVAAALLAAAIAFGLSPLMPLGQARVAEPHPGFSLDWLAIGGGAICIVVLALVVGLMPAWRASRARSGALGMDSIERKRPSAAGVVAARAGLPPSAVAGIRMAFEAGRGKTATPVRSALVGTAFAIAALTTAFGFAAGFQRLFSDPHLSGWNWQEAAGIPFTGDLSGKLVAPLRSSPVVAGLSAVNDSASVQFRTAGGHHATAGVLATDTVVGDVHPPVLTGRWPTSPGEIALGNATLRSLHARIGDSVTATIGSRHVSMRVVGTAVFVNASGTSTNPGDGAGMTYDALRRLSPKAPRNIFLITFRDGVSTRRGTTAIAPILRGAGVTPLGWGVMNSVGDLRPVRDVPLVLAALLALAAAATLAHSLLTSIRRRRRDLAILKTLGFVRRQVSATVAWQATAMSVVALLFGILVGVALGRWAWTLYANQLGVKAEPTVWLGTVVLIVPVTILVANALAAIPGRIAARTEPAVVLRSE